MGDRRTAGGSAPEQVGPFAQRVRQAWKDAGREGAPKIGPLLLLDPGGTSRGVEGQPPRDYYAFLGEWVDGIAEGAPRGPDAVRDTAKRFEDAGIDELIFDPTVADLREVDLLADAL